MGGFKLCFVFDENGNYKPVPYSKLMDGDERKEEFAGMMKANLHKTIAMLDDDDRRLIRMLYFDMQTEQHCAEVFDIDQSTMNRRKRRALSKLKVILLADA